MDSTKSDCPAVTTTISYGTVKNNKEKFNIAKFLDRAPSGLMLWNKRTQTSVTFRNVERRENGTEFVIVTYDADKYDLVCFDEYGRELSSFYGVIYNADVDLFPDSSNLFWSTEKSPNLAAEIILPRCTGSIIIDGSGDALLVGKEEYYYWSCDNNGEPYIETCRFHKLNYNGARFAEFNEANAFVEKLQNNGYDYVKGYVIAHPEPKPKNDKELKQKGFEYGDDICKWVNSKNNIEVVSIVPDNRGFTNSNFILFYYEK